MDTTNELKKGSIIEKFTLCEKIDDAVWTVSRDEQKFIMKFLDYDERDNYRNECRYNDILACGITAVDGEIMYYIVLTLYPETLHGFIRKLHKQFGAPIGHRKYLREKDNKKCQRKMGIRSAFGIMRKCVIKLLECIATLHARRVIHTDIKPANIVITASYENILHGADFEMRLIDYEFAHDARNARVCRLGTACYASPEGLTYSIYNEATDIWSVGCVIFELLLRECIAESNEPQIVLDEIEKMCGPVSNSHKNISMKRDPNYLYNRLRALYSHTEATYLSQFLMDIFTYKDRPSAKKLLERALKNFGKC